LWGTPIFLFILLYGALIDYSPATDYTISGGRIKIGLQQRRHPTFSFAERDPMLRFHHKIKKEGKEVSPHGFCETEGTEKRL